MVWLSNAIKPVLSTYSDEETGRKFIFIIDEWDALIREAKGDAETQSIYLSILRGWFKNGNFTPRVVAAAYMTGILPIKKDGSQSAISDFREYSILDPEGLKAFRSGQAVPSSSGSHLFLLRFSETRSSPLHWGCGIAA